MISEFKVSYICEFGLGQSHSAIAVYFEID